MESPVIRQASTTEVQAEEYLIFSKIYYAIIPTSLASSPLVTVQSRVSNEFNSASVPLSEQHRNKC